MTRVRGVCTCSPYFGCSEYAHDCPRHGVDAQREQGAARPVPPVDAGTEAESTLTIEIIARIWRDHSNCNWISNGVNVVWSCGIIHHGPLHMQPTTRDRHVAALVMTQIEADRHILAARLAGDRDD